MDYKFHLLYGPEDAAAGSGTEDTVDSSVEETVEEIEPEIIEDGEQENAETIEEDESSTPPSKPKETDAERSEEKDDDLEKLGPVTGNVVKQAAQEFKGLFNKYPELRSNYFFARDVQQFFGSVEEAKQAATTVENFQAIVEEIDSGDPGSIVEYIGNNKDTLYKFGRKFLNSVLEKNPDVFPHLTGPYVAQLLKSAAKDAKASGNKNLELSVEHIANYIFGLDGKIPDDPGVPEDAPKQDNKALVQQFINFRDEAFEAGSNNLTSYVENSLAALKTNKPGLKKMLVKEISAEIDRMMSIDNAHMARMNRMWMQAKKGLLTPKHRAAIINAHADAIKKLLPIAREKVLRENGFKVSKVNKQKDELSFAGTKPSKGESSRQNSFGKRNIMDLSPAERLAHYAKE
jgi:hypothetical protein